MNSDFNFSCPFVSFVVEIKMERNVQKNGLVNMVAAVMIFIAAFVVTAT